MINHKIFVYLITEPGVKKHVCTTCGKAFTRSYALTRHIVSHTKVKNYICKICGQAYCDLRGLKTHQKQMHEANFFDINSIKDPDPKPNQPKLEKQNNSQNSIPPKNIYVPNIPNTSTLSNNSNKDLSNDNSYHGDAAANKNKIFQPIKFVEDTNRQIHNNNRVEQPVNTPTPYLPNIPKRIPNVTPTSTASTSEPFQENYSYLKKIHEYKINSQAKFCQSLFDYSNSNLSPQNMCLLTNQEKFYNNLNIKNLNGNHFAQQFAFNDILNVWNLDGHQMPPPNFPNADNFSAGNSHQRMWK